MVTLGTNKSGCYTEVTLLYSQVYYVINWIETNLGLELASGCYRVADLLTQVTINTGSTVYD